MVVMRMMRVMGMTVAFLADAADMVVMAELRLPHRVFTLPCGHYTTGQFPFNWIDGLAMCRFAARHL